MYYSETRRFLEQFDTQEARTIVFTGTKGKTTLGLLLSSALESFYDVRIKIDTTGVYWNDQLIFTKDDSMNHFGYSPTVLPGRYLLGLFKNKKIDYSKVVLIIEASLTSGIFGTGLVSHDVGILTNIFSDHIDYERVKDRKDLALLKSFVYREIKEGGVYVTNVDNDLCLKTIDLPELEKKNIRKVGVSNKIVESEAYDVIKSHSLNSLIVLLDDSLVQFPEKKILFSHPLLTTDQTFAANISCCFASLIHDKKVDLSVIDKKLQNFTFPDKHGRNLIFSKGQEKVYVDFAHEITSQQQLIERVSRECGQKPYLITRLSPEYSDSYLRKYAQELSSTPIKGVIVFDKIDGVKRELFRNRKDKVRVAGETAKIIRDELIANNSSINVDLTSSESLALMHALNKKLHPLIHIYDNLDETLELIKQRGFVRVET